MPFPNIHRHTAATSNTDGYEPVETTRTIRARVYRKRRAMRRAIVAAQ
jgi:hypothetical protein